MRNRRIPSYRKHKVSGHAVVTLNGRDFYLGPHGSEESHAKYKRHVAEWLSGSEQLPPGVVGRSSLSVAEVMLAYWKWVEQHYRKDGRPTGEQGAIKAALRPV